MTETLILVPTPGEYSVLQPKLQSLLQTDEHGQAANRMEVCGFGPVSAAARTAYLIVQLQPKRILLTGIAGALDRDLSPGHAYAFHQVAVYGIGAGSGDTYLNACELGWPHWSSRRADGSEFRINDQIDLRHNASQTSDESETLDAQPDDEVVESQRVAAEQTDDRLLLTVCAAAATQKEVRDRLAKFPTAAAEDMEAFSVALAARMAGVPLDIVRGISNIAGDRDKRRWRIVDALHSAADLILSNEA